MLAFRERARRAPPSLACHHAQIWAGVLRGATCGMAGPSARQIRECEAHTVRHCNMPLQMCQEAHQKA